MKITEYELELVRRKAMVYKTTRNEKDFEEVLRLTDNLIVLTVHKLRRSKWHLSSIPPQELYHIGIIGLYDSLDKMPEDILAIKIPLWIMAYVKSHIRKEFSYLEKEHIPIEDYDHHTVKSDYKAPSIYDSSKERRDSNLLSDLASYSDTEVIKEEERILLEERFLHGHRRGDLAKKYDVLGDTITNRIKRATRKISNITKKEEEYYMEEQIEARKEEPNRYCQYCRNYLRGDKKCSISDKFTRKKGTCGSFERR